MATRVTAPGISEGTQLTPTLRLVRKLGQGGMGSVWAAHHSGLDTLVAVKLIDGEGQESVEAAARFAREASAAASIRSPHVVQILDHGLSPTGLPFIAMELLEGEEIGKRIARLGKLSLGETVLIVAHAAKALSKAHAAGIVHRDIKPDNLFAIDQDGEMFVKVLDFGIAKRSGPDGLGMTSTGTTLGTPYYMAPEQIANAKAAGPPADIWSLGVVAYHCLTGTVPYTANSYGALVLAVDRGCYTPVSSVRPDVPAAVDAWVAKAMAHDPAKRFSSVKEMADELSRIAGAASRGAEHARAALPPGLASSWVGMLDVDGEPFDAKPLEAKSVPLAPPPATPIGVPCAPPSWAGPISAESQRSASIPVPATLPSAGETQLPRGGGFGTMGGLSPGTLSERQLSGGQRNSSKVGLLVGAALVGVLATATLVASAWHWRTALSTPKSELHAGEDAVTGESAPSSAPFPSAIVATPIATTTPNGIPAADPSASAPSPSASTTSSAGKPPAMENSAAPGTAPPRPPHLRPSSSGRPLGF